MINSSEGIPTLTLEQATKFVNNWNELGRKKGLLIIGPPGHGKTTLIKTLEWGTNFKNGTKVNGFYHMNTIVERFEDTGKINFLKESLQRGIANEYRCFDDLGVERIANYYSSKINVMDYIVDNFKGCSYTTNLNLKRLTDKYGERTVGRLKEHCYIIMLKDKDFRTLNTNEEIQNILNHE